MSQNFDFDAAIDELEERLESGLDNEAIRNLKRLKDVIPKAIKHAERLEKVGLNTKTQLRELRDNQAQVEALLREFGR